MSVFWARVGGFPWWPCRRASEAERAALQAHWSSQKKNATDKDKHCVVFLGSPLQKGWVTNKSFAPFDEQSLSLSSSGGGKLLLKALNTDQHYLEALVEACRISREEGLTVPRAVLTALRDAARETWQDFDEIDWSRDDVCTVCRGTEWSGESLLCDDCNFRETHLHCLQPSLMKAPPGDWFCPVCDRPTASTSKMQSSSGGDGGQRRAKRSLDDKGYGGGSLRAEKRGRATSSLRGTSGERERERAEHLRCEVCKGVGRADQLVTCTFPACSLAYHPGCVHKRITFSLSEYPARCHATPAPGASLLFDPWFCPAHFCASCSALEDPRQHSRSAGDGPEEGGASYPLFVIAGGLHRRGLQELHHCSKCPLSLCAACEGVAAAELHHCQNNRMFRSVPSKLFSESGELLEEFIAKDKRNPREAHSEREGGAELCCALCLSRAPPLQLARLLEKILATMMINKLSTPYLAPLLPGLEDFVPTASCSEDAEHLLGLMERVRRLHYHTFEQFRKDLDKLRSRVRATLENLFCKTYDPDDVNAPSAEEQRCWVESHCLLQSFDTVCDEAIHLAPEKLKLLEALQQSRPESSHHPAPPHALLVRWRAECEAELPAPYSSLHLVAARTEGLWRRHLSLSVSQHAPHPQVVEVVQELRQSEDYNTKSTAEILLNMQVVGGDTVLSSEPTSGQGDGPWCRSQLGESSTRELFQVLQESTKTSLQVQGQLSRKFHESENLFRCGDTDVTMGDLHMLTELKLANDNLRWRLNRQTQALDSASAVIGQLREGLEACRCRGGQVESGCSGAGDGLP